MNNGAENSTQISIMIIDDTPANLQVLAGMLKDGGYKVRPVPSGKLAIKAAENEPPDLILLDIMMPEMDGYDVCRKLKSTEKLKDIPVIFISAMSDTPDKVKALGVGGVDYITKPFQFAEVRARVETHLKIRKLQIELQEHNLQLQKLVEIKVKEISDSQMATIIALARLAESRDYETGKHIERVQIYCKMLADHIFKKSGSKGKMDNAYVENIFHASPLHDIGKVGISDHILLKPGKLTTEEFEIMKTHTTIGARTLEAVRVKYPKNVLINMGTVIARFHHEKWDGTGYPNGLAGEDIPLSARIMAVVDVYDALRAKRCYKQPLNHKESCDIIIKDEGKAFDPVIVEAFKELADRFETVHEDLSG